MVINPLPTHHYVNGEVDLESTNNFWSSRLRLLAKSKRKLHLQMFKKKNQNMPPYCSYGSVQASVSRGV